VGAKSTTGSVPLGAKTTTGSVPVVVPVVVLVGFCFQGANMIKLVRV